MTWRRLLDEPIERNLSLRVSDATSAELAAVAGANRVSTNEILRFIIRDGLDRIAAGQLTVEPRTSSATNDEPDAKPKVKGE